MNFLKCCVIIVDMMKCNKTCSVFGHSDIEQTEDLKNKINLECES